MAKFRSNLNDILVSVSWGKSQWIISVKNHLGYITS